MLSISQTLPVHAQISNVRDSGTQQIVRGNMDCFAKVILSNSHLFFFNFITYKVPSTPNILECGYF